MTIMCIAHVYQHHVHVLGKVCDDKSPLLWQHLILLSSKSLHQLSPHHKEDRAQEGTTKDERCIQFCQTLTEDWYMTETHPPEQERLYYCYCVHVNHT